MTSRTTGILFVLLLGTAASAWTESRMNFAWWNSPIRADLKLTDEQSTKIREIVHSYRNQLLDARNNAVKAEGDLEDLLNDDRVNMASAKPVIERLAEARANSTRIFTEMSLELRSVLTLDQWRTLVRKYSETRRKQPDTQVTP